MKVIVEREYVVMQEGTCEVDTINETILHKVLGGYFEEKDKKYLDNTRKPTGKVRIYSEDKSVKLYG